MYVVFFISSICASTTLTALVAGALPAWMFAGVSRFIVGRIRGKRMEFAELFRGGKHTLATWGAMLQCSLFVLLPLIPIVLLMVTGIICGLAQLHPDVIKQITYYAGIVGNITIVLLNIFASLMMMRSSFFTFVIADKNCNASDGVGISQALTVGNFWRIVAVNILMGLLGQLATALVCLGWIPLLPFQFVVWGVMYAEMSNIQDTGPGDDEPPPGH